MNDFSIVVSSVNLFNSKILIDYSLSPVDSAIICEFVYDLDFLNLWRNKNA